jgi:hypothetical protein
MLQVAQPDGQIALCKLPAQMRDAPAHPRKSRVDWCPNRMRQKTYFVRRFRHITLSSPSRKNISLSYYPKM